jgi:hypothetical protein
MERDRAPGTSMPLLREGEERASRGETYLTCSSVGLERGERGEKRRGEERGKGKESVVVSN